MEGSRMGKALEKTLDETCRMPGVTGAICVDQRGLTLADKGQVSRNVSGPVAALAQQANSISPQSFCTPVVVIESQNGKVMIKQEEGFTSAVFKS